MIEYADGAIDQGDDSGAVMALAHVNVLLKKELKDTEKLLKLLVKEEKDGGLMQKLRNKFNRTQVSEGSGKSSATGEHESAHPGKQASEATSGGHKERDQENSGASESSDQFAVPDGIAPEVQEDRLSTTGERK